MILAINTILKECRRHWRMMALWGLLLAVAWQALMLIALIVRFQAWPNYSSFYNWPGNVWHIIRSTPSWSDIPPIVAEEWLIEIGKMNYDYGIGISEWSLNVVPSRLLVLFFLGFMCALFFRLYLRRGCRSVSKKSTVAATGVGVLLVGMTNATMSWVVCCATPSWVVGLAMLGLGVSTSLAIENLGMPLMLAGFSILGCAILLLAWNDSKSHIELSAPGIKGHA